MIKQTQAEWDRLHGSQYEAEMRAREQAERDRLHGNRMKCTYEPPPVCSVRWTQEDWDRRCLNPKHRMQVGD